MKVVWSESTLDFEYSLMHIFGFCFTLETDHVQIGHNCGALQSFDELHKVLMRKACDSQVELQMST